MKWPCKKLLELKQWKFGVRIVEFVLVRNRGKDVRNTQSC